MQINCSLHESTGLEQAPDCKTLIWLQHRNSAVVQSHGQMKPIEETKIYFTIVQAFNHFPILKPEGFADFCSHSTWST